MKFQIRELDDGSWLLEGGRRWPNDSDNDQVELSFPTFKAMLGKMQRMMAKEYRQREKNSQ